MAAKSVFDILRKKTSNLGYFQQFERQKKLQGETKLFSISDDAIVQYQEIGVIGNTLQMYATLPYLMATIDSKWIEGYRILHNSQIL